MKNSKRKAEAILVPGEIIKGTRLSGVAYFGEEQTRRSGRSRVFAQYPATAVLTADGKLMLDYRIGEETASLEAAGTGGSWKEGGYVGTLDKVKHATGGAHHCWCGTWKDATMKGDGPPFFLDLREVEG